MLRKELTLVVVSLAGAAFASAAAAQTAGIRALRCNACSAQQFEQAAIGQGAGLHHLYDFSAGVLRAYRVDRQPTPRGGHTYDVVEQPVDPVHRANFDLALYAHRNGGTRRMNIELALAGAPGTDERPAASVFDLFATADGARRIADRLAGDIRNSAPAEVRVGTKELQAFLLATPALDLADADARLHVTVTFKDGLAEFELAGDTRRYAYVADSAIDADFHPVPATREQIEPAPYQFPGGAASDTYRGFQALMQRLGVPTGPGGWQCEIAGDGRGTQSCRLDSTSEAR